MCSQPETGSFALVCDICRFVIHNAFLRGGQRRHCAAQLRARRAARRSNRTRAHHRRAVKTAGGFWGKLFLGYSSRFLLVLVALCVTRNRNSCFKNLVTNTIRDRRSESTTRALFCSCPTSHLQTHFKIAPYANVTEFLVFVAQRRGKLKVYVVLDLDFRFSNVCPLTVDFV